MKITTWCIKRIYFSYLYSKRFLFERISSLASYQAGLKIEMSGITRVAAPGRGR